jgi:hypothetical protein
MLCSFNLQVRVHNFIFKKIPEGMLLVNFLIAQYFRGLLVQLSTIWAIHLVFSLLGCLGY